MTALIVLVLSVAAVDSLNPSTVGPALVLAITPSPAARVAAFTAGVFAVSTLGGAVLLIGPGRQLLARVAKPSPHLEHLASAVCGVIVLAVAVVLWLRRNRKPRSRTRSASSTTSSLALGAGIMAVELPTAFPYFAAVVAIVGSRRSAATELLLLAAYNVVFVAPMLAIVGLSLLAGEHAARRLAALRSRLEQRVRIVIPIALAALGVGLLVFGLVGL